MPNELTIRDVRPVDAAVIAEVYNPYIMDTVITFEETPVTAAEIQGRIEATLKAGLPYIVAELDGVLIGYAYAGPWRTRAAYKHTVESSIYLSREITGHGYGSVLYKALLQRLRALDYHVILGSITLPNPVSVSIHEKLGFVKVAHFTQVGYKFGRWLDVGFWELVISDL